MGGGRRFPGSFSHGQVERWEGTPVREGQTDSAFAGFLRQRSGGRSGANFGVEFTVVGVLRLSGGTWESVGLGAGRSGWICGFQLVAGAWCVATNWMSTSFGLVLTPTGIEISFRRSSGCEPFPGWLSVDTFITQRYL